MSSSLFSSSKISDTQSLSSITREGYSSGGSMDTILNIPSYNLMDNIQKLNRIKDMLYGNPDGERDFQVCITHINKISSQVDMVNFFNIVVTCKEGTYGRYILDVLVDTKMGKMRGIFVKYINSSIQIVKPITAEDINRLECKAQLKSDGFVLLCTENIARHKVQEYMKRYFKGYVSYYHVVGHKIISCYGRSCGSINNTTLDDIDSAFSNELRDIENATTRRRSQFSPIWILFIIFILILIAVAISAMSDKKSIY